MATAEATQLAKRLDALNLHTAAGHEETGFSRIKEWLAPHAQHFELYLGRFNRIFGLETGQRINQRFGEAIEKNHMTSLIISSKEYGDVVEAEKELMGRDTTVGISKCIDGRLSTVHSESRVFKVHETMAGHLETEDIEMPKGGTKTILKSERLVEAIKDEVKNKGQLLEILLAHTDFHDPQHGCGAMLAAQAEHPDIYPPGTDLIVANLNEHKKAAAAIDNLYNEAAEFFGKNEQKKTAVTGVYDTHTMGVMLGYGEENKTFYTTDIVRDMVRDPDKYIVFTGSFDPSDYYPGVIQNELQKPEKLVQNESMIATLSGALLREHNPFFKQVQEYIMSHSELSQLSEPQQKALRFYLARTTALQYLSKAYEGVHPFVEHDEILQSISSDGVTFGQFLPDQTFCASPNENEVVGHILTQVKLMNANSRIQEKPYLLFVSGVLSHKQNESSAERAKAMNLKLYKKVVNDPRIREAILSGDLLPVPVLINDKTRDIIAIQNGVGAI